MSSTPALLAAPQEQRRAPTGATGRLDWLVVLVLCLLAFGLRAPELWRAYWIDEGISIGISSHPLSQIPALLREDGSPPLFYFLLHFWMRLFGQSEAATHSLPLAVSIANVPVGYVCGRWLYDRRAGLAAAALFATNPFLNWYATETRMYTMVVLEATVAVTLAWKAFEGRSLKLACWAVLAYGLVLYTHDWGIYLTAVTAAVLLLSALARRDLQLARAVALASAGAYALWLPWLPSFIEQARNTAAPWAVAPQIGDLFADPSTAIGGTAGVVVAPMLVGGAIWTRGLRPRRYGAIAGMMVSIGALCALAGFVGAQLEPSWTVRYLAVLVGPILLGAAGAMAYHRRGLWVLGSVCALLSVWGAVGMALPNPNARYAKSNVAAVASLAAPHLRPGDLVVVTQTEQTSVLYHYLPKGLSYLNPTGPVSDPSVVDWKDLVQRLQVATPCEALGPSLAEAPVGSYVLEVNPARALGASGSAWSKAVNGQVLADDSFLASYPGLEAVAMYNPASDPAPFSPVDAVLFKKVAPGPSCSY